jgi:adenine-specific DNA-methyltransferase
VTTRSSSLGRIQELEAQRLVEQQRLDDLKDAGERNRLGQFATPTALARDIAKYTRNLWQERSVPVRFLDPAIGTGSFYSALREAFPSGLVERATGFEIDYGFAEAASQLWASEGLDLTVSDFTVEYPRDDDDRFNLVLTNPPYVWHHHLTVSQKQQLKTAVYRELGLEISGLAGFYCYFMLLADKWLDVYPAFGISQTSLLSDFFGFRDREVEHVW